MKKVLPALLFAFFAWSVQAQFSILVVDDSADNFNNVDSITIALDSLGYTYDVYDAATLGEGPAFDLMSQYNLLIWHTSTDGDGRYLWNGFDEDNGALAFYLEEGGNLWVIGNDFLFDRYGGAPATFTEEEFPYKYFGISSYDAQSRGDDGGDGVAEMTPVDGAPIEGLPTLNWIFATLWWADAVTPVDGALPVYEMGGPDTYPLKGQPSAVLYDNGTFRTLSYYFDLSLASSADLRKTAIEAVMNYWESVISNTIEVDGARAHLQAMPNPFVEQVTLGLELEQPSTVSLGIFDASGKELARLLSREKLGGGQHNLQWRPAATLPNGIYFARLEVNGKIAAERLSLFR